MTKLRPNSTLNYNVVRMKTPADSVIEKRSTSPCLQHKPSSQKLTEHL